MDRLSGDILQSGVLPKLQHVSSVVALLTAAALPPAGQCNCAALLSPQPERRSAGSESGSGFCRQAVQPLQDIRAVGDIGVFLRHVVKIGIMRCLCAVGAAIGGDKHVET